MKNDKNGKQVSRLTGALLARKGSAAPSQASLLMNQSVINRYSTQGDEISRQDVNFKPEEEIESFLENTIRTVKELTARQNGTANTDGSVLKGKKPQRSATTDPAEADHVNLDKGKVSTKKSNFAKSSKDPAAKKRIAMTLRMEEEDHLKLRIFSAHTRKSCQVILSEALDLYLMENSDKIPLQKMTSQDS